MTGDFYGLPTRIIGNRHLRLEFLAEAGPRIVRLMLGGSDENLLVEVPDLHWSTPYGEYFPRGGHRLCHAPEAFPRTYIPDNSGLTVDELANGVRLCQPPEPDTGIRKYMEIYLHDDAPAVTIIHCLQNDGAWPVELAPWAITQMPLGGVAILPQPSPVSDSSNLLPNRHLVLWPYTSWQDSRLRLYDDHVLVQAEAQLPACKVGYLNQHGWIGYLRGGVFFAKHFAPQPGKLHADRGCNVEAYCNEHLIELETLGPLVRLLPGEFTQHVETWRLVSLDVQPTIDGVRELARALNARFHRDPSNSLQLLDLEGARGERIIR